MSERRASERDLKIPLPKDLDRRQRCLGDPQLFLQTYFGSAFFQPFTPDREAMLQGIIDASRYGGDSAIAGPRGEGKTRIAIYGALYLMVSGLSPFPMVISKSGGKAANELKTIRERLQQSPVFAEDFPEIGVPFNAVGNWASRAKMQTVGGKYSNIEIFSDHIIFPTIERDQLPDDWPDEIEPASKGQIFSSMGIDGPIRGTNYKDKRPTLAIIDDIEDAESANSDSIIQKNEDIIEKDIGGLGGSGRRVSRIMLCTIQNRKCIAYQYTDSTNHLKRSWNGRRYRKMVQPPARMDLVEQYIEMRINRDADDPDARKAFGFWKEKQREIEAGCIISNPYSFDKREHIDGDTIELSAIQAYYNNVADRGAEAVATEDDNDPPETIGPQGSGLTAKIVSERSSGLDRLQCPVNTVAITAGIDIGKYICHWTLVAWWKGAGGTVIDYGVVEVPNTTPDMSKEASEPMIYNALLNWRNEMMGTKIVDASGAERTLDAAFVDSGDFTDAAYEFVRQVGGTPYYAAKGVGKYRPPMGGSDCILGHNLHCRKQANQSLWLYSLDTDYWKQWVHERFLTPTFDEKNRMRPGAMSIYSPPGRNKQHLSFSQHIVAEEFVSEFQEGKGEKKFWLVHNRNNHWLDATYMAAAAASTQGISVMANASSPTLIPTKIASAKARQRQSSHAGRKGQSRYRQRTGGWIQGARRSR